MTSWWRKADVDKAAKAPQEAVQEAERVNAEAHADLFDALAALRKKLGIPIDEALDDIGDDLRGRK